MNKLVSVIIPTYNRATIISRAIKSVMLQTYSNYEIIVVDDGSSDQTEDIVRKFEKVKYIKHHINLNGAAARNTGIAHAKGDYIAFLDSDDEWLPEKLEKQIHSLEKIQSNLKISYSQLYLFKNGFEEGVFPKRGLKDNELIEDYLFVNEGLMQTSTLVGSKALFEKVKFDENLIRHQDWDLCLSFANLSDLKYAYLDEPLSIWHGDDNLDRVSRSMAYEFSMNWINSHRKKISTKSYTAIWDNIIIPEKTFHGEMLFKAEKIRLIINNFNKVALYGAGETTKYILSTLPENERKKIHFIIDQSENKQGRYLSEIKVMSLDRGIELNPEVIIISVQNYDIALEIKSNLDKLNINSIKI